jgi:predicted ATPase/class 3 adenylate cyclase
MHRLGTYIPQDRLRALIGGESLPSHTVGSAIFADISGFTLLTEKLTQTLGARPGVEALSQQLNAVYGALIDQVERYGGSVISFAGDSIIGWFEEAAECSSPSWRAVTCAEGMQAAMREFQELSLRVAVTSGEARRLVVGDPAIQLMDTLAGKTVARLATADRLAWKGEIILDGATLQAVEDKVKIREQRSDPDSAEAFFIVDALQQPAESLRFPQPDNEAVQLEILRPWLLAAVYQREHSGMISFLTELRPAVPLFVSFSGIDYDNDPGAEQKLNAFIARAQRLTAKYDGSLLQLVIGDKGSYIYAAFGAFTAHEDDAQRAIYAALELKQTSQELPYIQSIQSGISLGTLRVGAYGNATRQTYAALGDDVNLAARLMTTAKPDEILITGKVQVDGADVFTLEPREPIRMKGKGEPQSVFAVTGVSHHRATRLPEPAYRLPMVGRQQELNFIDEKLKLALQGKGQVIGITAEAGMGKSRLVAEVIRLARKRGFVGYGGACQSSGTNTSYLVWQPIWQAFFDLDPEMPQRKQMRLLEGELEDRVQERVDSLPLLGLILDLPLPDNEFTQSLDPKDRKSALESLLEECLKSAAGETPLLIVLEDLHWIDALSHDLLETLVRVSENLSICFVLAYRPPDMARLQIQRLEGLAHFSKVELKYLTAADAEQLIRAKLALLFPERTGKLPKALADELILKSQGNPFFIEELLNYLHDRGLNPFDARALQELELPASLQTLILSRIDQLTEPLKVTLKVASVIGRVFPFSWLYGYYPSLGEESIVKSHLAELSKLDLTPLDTPDPELAYLFKHIVTQEVAYESLSFTTRAQLHELLARYLEASYPDDLPIEALAHHYSRSNNTAKKREYLRKSGDAARAAFSNMAALDYYRQALELSPELEEAIDLHINSGAVYQLIGEPGGAREHYRTALQIATERNIVRKIMQCEIRLGSAWVLNSNYLHAMEWLEKAVAHGAQIDDRPGICEALIEIGIIHWRLANTDQAAEYLQKGIEIARELRDKKREAYALTVMGQLEAQVGNRDRAHAIYDTAFALAKEINDKRRMSGILNNHANAYYLEGNYEMAETLMKQTLDVAREIGDKRGLALALNNVGNIVYMKNDFVSAQTYYEQALKLGRESEDKYVKSIALVSMGITLFRQGKLAEANLCYQESFGLSTEMGDKVGLSLTHCYLGLLALAQGHKSAAQHEFVQGLRLAHESNYRLYVVYNLIGIASCWNEEGRVTRAVTLLGAVTAITAAMGFKIESELQEPLDKVFADTRAKLSEEEFQSAWQAGGQMDFDGAINFTNLE